MGGGMFAFAEIRNVEAARSNPETVLSLSAEDAAAAKEAEKNAKEYAELTAKPTVTEGTVLYACPGGSAFAISYGGDGGRAALTLNGDTFALDPVYVAEGAQFSDGHYTFRTQGEMAAIVLGDDVVYDSCRVTHDAAVTHSANAGN